MNPLLSLTFAPKEQVDVQSLRIHSLKLLALRAGLPGNVEIINRVGFDSPPLPIGRKAGIQPTCP